MRRMIEVAFSNEFSPSSAHTFLDVLLQLERFVGLFRMEGARLFEFAWMDEETDRRVICASFCKLENAAKQPVAKRSFDRVENEPSNFHKS